MTTFQRVGVEFTGSAAGALNASKQAAAGIRSVRTEAAGSSAPLRTFENDLGKTTRGALAGSGAFHSLGRSLAFASAGFLGAAGITSVLRGAADELVTQVKLGAQVAAALRSTGGVAGETAKSIDALAAAEHAKTGADSTQVKAAEVMLLRFTNVRRVLGDNNDIFKRATQAALDLAAAQGGTAADAAATLGKALQDPYKGVTLLRRANVALTAAEVEHIKTLAAHGHVLQAQSAILDAVARSYGGTAKAVGDVTPWSKLGNTLKALSADAIRPLLPEMDSIVARAQKWADGVGKNAELQQRLKRDVEETVGTIKDFAQGADTVVGALGGWRHTIEALLALKFASMVAGWAGALKTLIGTEALAGGSGLLGAGAASTSLLTKMRLLAAKPWVIAIGLSFIPPSKKGQDALDRAGIGFLGHLPILGGFEQQIGRLGAYTFGGNLVEKPKTVSVGKAGSTAGTAVSSYAKQYGVGSGITYHWGGISPITGFDCSGYVAAAYASAGVTIPRDTRGQWNDPNAVKVAAGSERPGDAVYFEGSLTGKNAGPPPGHVGIYLGGGIFIEYFSEGKPAKTDNLANRPDYMGARRWLKITDTKGAAPPTSGSGALKSGNAIPAGIRQAIAAANVAVAAAALTPGKADDRAAVAESKAALESEIAWLNAKLATKLGVEKRITLEDLLTGALGSLAGLTPAGKKKGGATISTITGMRAAVNATLADLPTTLDDVEQNAAAKLTMLRDHLKVGMKAKDLADTRASIKRWGVVLSDEISKQAKIAATAAQDAAALWQRGWQNDVNRVLRDFQENVINRQLDAFDRDTAAHLKGLQDRFGSQTAEERALAAFDAAAAAADEAKQRADIALQITDAQASLDALGGGGSSGTLIDIATGQRTGLPGGTGDIVQQRKDLLATLAGLQEQSAALDRQDQRAALQSAADLSRTAADKQLADAESAYQDQRDAQRQALNDVLSDQQTALQQSLDDWGQNIDRKKAAWVEFLQWLRDHGYSTVGLADPGATGGGGALGGLASLPFARGARALPFASGGRVPGMFVGRDSVPIIAEPGERVLTREMNAMLERWASGGGSAGPTVAVFKINDRVIATAIAQPTSAEQARQIGYVIQRG